MQRIKEKKIRLNAKQLFLTYPKCDMGLLYILNYLRDKLRLQNIEIVNHIVAHEEHKDGEPHRHVYLELNSPIIGNSEANMLDIISIDNRRWHGNYQTAKNPTRVIGYTTKEGSFISNFSESELKKLQAKYLSLQEKKMSKAEICTRLLGGEKLETIVAEYPQLLFDYMKLRSSYNLYVSNTRKLQDLPILDNEWRWGAPGCGKSKYCRDNYAGAFRKNKEFYWNGYNGEDVVVLEDVDISWQPVMEQFKIWADHYPFMALIKLGDPINIRPKRIVVTSNYTIEELMTKMGNKDGEFLKALSRRFNEINMDDQYKYDFMMPYLNLDL